MTEVQQLYLFIQQVQAQRDKPTHTTVGDITLSYNPSGRTEQVVISRYQRRIGMALATAWQVSRRQRTCWSRRAVPPTATVSHTSLVTATR